MSTIGDKRRYYIAASVLLEIVTPRFKDRLEKEYRNLGFTCLRDFLSSRRGLHPLFHQRYRNVKCCTDQENCRIPREKMDLVSCQWETLFTENSEKGRHDRVCYCIYTANRVDLDDLDITLAGTILVTCFDLPKDSYMIRSLVQMKEEYFTHNTKGALCEMEYQLLWPELMYLVLEFDPDAQDELLEIQRRYLDMVKWYNYTVELLNIQPQLNKHLRLKNLSENHNDRPRECRTCSYNNTQQASQIEKGRNIQIKPYTLGQPIFFLHHTIDLRAIMAGMLGDINNYLGVMADDTCIRTSLHVSDGTIMEGDRLVFCFPNMCALLLCDMDGLLAEIILLDGTPHFLTAVNGNTIAVAMTTNETVFEFYDTNTRDKVKSIRINQELRHLGGLATLDGKLVLGVNEQLVFIDYMTNQEVKTTKLSFNPTIIHVAEDMVYTSGRNTNFLPYTNDNENLLGYNYRTDVETTIRVTSPITSLTSLGDRSLYMICEDGSLFHVSADGASKKKIPRDQLDIQGKCPIIRYSVMQKKLLAFDKHTGNVQIFHEL